MAEAVAQAGEMAPTQAEAEEVVVRVEAFFLFMLEPSLWRTQELSLLMAELEVTEVILQQETQVVEAAELVEAEEWFSCSTDRFRVQE